MSEYLIQGTIDLHVIWLSILVFIHSVISLSSFGFIIAFSLGYDNKYLDLLAASIVISFLVFRQCVAIDIYDYFKENRNELPRFAKDNFLRNLILGKKDKDLTSLRLDKINNNKPLAEAENEELVDKFFNRKIHYIGINLILAVLICIKYKHPELIMFLIPWILFNFPAF